VARRKTATRSSASIPSPLYWLATYIHVAAAEPRLRYHVMLAEYVKHYVSIVVLVRSMNRCITFVARPLCRPYRYANDLSIQMSSPLPPPFPPFPLSGFVALLVSPPNPPSNDAPIRPSPVPPPPTPALSPPPSPPLPPPASSEPSLNGRLLAASVGGGDSSCSTPASSSPESSPRLRGLYGHSQSSVLVVLSSRLSKDSEPVLTNHRLS
jgi:hypothetical protein